MIKKHYSNERKKHLKEFAILKQMATIQTEKIIPPKRTEKPPWDLDTNSDTS